MDRRVYIDLNDEMNIRIGSSGNVPERTRVIQSTHYREVFNLFSIPGNEDVEKLLQYCLYRHAIDKDWFSAKSDKDPEVWYLIEELRPAEQRGNVVNTVERLCLEFNVPSWPVVLRPSKNMLAGILRQRKWQNARESVAAARRYWEPILQRRDRREIPLADIAAGI
jgi:hypothetical protein